MKHAGSLNQHQNSLPDERYSQRDSAPNFYSILVARKSQTFLRQNTIVKMRVFMWPKNQNNWMTHK